MASVHQAGEEEKRELAEKLCKELIERETELEQARKALDDGLAAAEARMEAEIGKARRMWEEESRRMIEEVSTGAAQREEAYEAVVAKLEADAVKEREDRDAELARVKEEGRKEVMRVRQEGDARVAEEERAYQVICCGTAPTIWGLRGTTLSDWEMACFVSTLCALVSALEALDAEYSDLNTARC